MKLECSFVIWKNVDTAHLCNSKQGVFRCSMSVSSVFLPKNLYGKFCAVSGTCRDSSDSIPVKLTGHLHIAAPR